MRVMEFGQQNRDVVMLLHGGGLSWWNYREVAELLGSQYHVVLPVLDGHADSGAPFTTIEDNAARLISYIDAHFGGQVLALGGLSLGGQIAVEMLSQRKDICRYALIESALVKPSKLTAAMIGPAFGMSYGLIRQKWFAKLQADYLGVPEPLFDDYFRDTCALSKADMIAFLKANSLYTIQPSLSETMAKVMIVAGAKEPKNIRDSAKLLREAIPGSRMEILPGLRHGDLSLNEPEQFVEIMMNWIGEQHNTPERYSARLYNGGKIMEYRQLPHGKENEKFSVIGLGLGGIGTTPVDEIEAIIRKAIDHGINFFDMCTAGATYAPVGRAIAGRREQVFLQVHFGAVYDEKGEYGWCRDFETIKKTFLWELEQLGTDYVDFGLLHCVDEDADFDKLIEIGVLDYLKELKRKGIVRHIGFSSHTPSVANRIIDTGLIDMMMFSINPAYDFEKGDEYGIGSVKERFDLFQRCAKEGVGISVMKPFFAGQLLSAEHSPFGKALTHNQCLQYAIDRPGVLVAVPGVQTMEHLDQVLKFLDATDEEKDYSVIGSFTADTITGTCVYCNHCQPCPAGIDIGLVNKYYDLALAGDDIAANHYTKLATKADACLQCGHCEDRCPFSVKQMNRMVTIDEYFSKR